MSTSPAEQPGSGIVTFTQQGGRVAAGGRLWKTAGVPSMPARRETEQPSRTKGP